MNRLKRIVRLIAGSAIIVYLVVCLVIFSLQRWLIFPGADTQGKAESAVRADAHEQLMELKAPDGAHIAALYGGSLTEESEGRATLIYCYGNGMCMADCHQIFLVLRRLGFNVIVPEYEGYGMSGGSAGEQGCYAAADAAYDWLVKNPAIDSHKIVAAGWSLGAAVAIDLASRREVAAVVTFSAFESMAAMGHKQYPWLPVSLLLKHRFDNLKKISQIKSPILLVHGEVDDFIPPVMCEHLAAAGGAKVQRINVPGASHNDLFDVGGDHLMQQVKQFVESLPVIP